MNWLQVVQVQHLEGEGGFKAEPVSLFRSRYPMGCNIFCSATGMKIVKPMTYQFYQVMIHEKFLYDRKTGEWTPEKYLQDLNIRCYMDKDMTW